MRSSLGWSFGLVVGEHEDVKRITTHVFIRRSVAGVLHFYVKPGSRGIKLHALWHGLLGTSGEPHTHLDYAIRIEREYPRSSLKELKKARALKEWNLASRFLAIEKVYLRGELKGSTSTENAPTLPEGYTKAAKAVAERQAALAAYRLADEIQRCVR